MHISDWWSGDLSSLVAVVVGIVFVIVTIIVFAQGDNPRVLTRDKRGSHTVITFAVALEKVLGFHREGSMLPSRIEDLVLRGKLESGRTAHLDFFVQGYRDTRGGHEPIRVARFWVAAARAPKLKLSRKSVGSVMLESVGLKQTVATGDDDLDAAFVIEGPDAAAIRVGIQRSAELKTALLSLFAKGATSVELGEGT
jgi:hypothetical protein